MGAKSFDIVAYQYKADIYCPACIISQLMAEGRAAPAAADMHTEDVLDQIAGAGGLDRMEERSFDSDEFPKVIFAIQIEDDETCGSCGEVLE